MSAIDISPAEMEKFVIRHADLPNRVSPVRVLDMALPEYERQRYPIVGRSAEQGWDDKRVGEVEGFNVMYVSCEPGRGIASHSHDAEEAFIVMTGKWAIILGENAETRVELTQFDMFSVPRNAVHGVENISDGPALILAIQDTHRAATINWSPAVVDKVRALGQQADGTETPGYD